MPDVRIDPASLPGRPCSVATALEIVGDRWSLLIVREVLLGNHRFNQFVRNTGAPRDRIAARLRDLVEAGVLERRTSAPAAGRDEYHATAAGRALAPVVQSLLEWGDTYAVTDPPVRLQHHEHPLLVVRVCATCGERVRGKDLHRIHLAAGWQTSGPTPPQTPLS
jgi:DNA-binding HxlR family transcriptional regulator